MTAIKTNEFKPSIQPSKTDITDTTTAKISDDNKKEKPFKSIGYKVHNELTYRGVDFLLNSTVGVAFTYWGSRTHTGQQYYSRPLSNAFKYVLKPIVKNPKRLQEGANWGMLFTSIIVGGTTIIPIMMGLENKDNKKAIVHTIDNVVYGKDYIASHPEFSLQDHRIEHEPKKDFSTGMAARFAVLVPMIAATLHVPSKEFLVKTLYNPIGKVSKFAAEDMRLMPSKTVEAMKKAGRKELVDGEQKFVSNWDFIHRTIGFDLGLTFIYAYAHEFAYKAFARTKQRHGDHFHGDGGDDNTYTLDELVTELDQTKSLPSNRHDSWQDKVQNSQSKVADLMAAENHETQIRNNREHAAKEYSVG